MSSLRTISQRAYFYDNSHFEFFLWIRRINLFYARYNFTNI